MTFRKRKETGGSPWRRSFGSC